MKYKVVHYINQFFAGRGGEDKADTGPEGVLGPVGPGMEAQRQVANGGMEIVGTVICGDGYYNEHLEQARGAILQLIRSFTPDILLAGPAFNAGRYGVACGDICETVTRELGIPAVTGMHPENPGVELYAPKGVYIVPTADNSRTMRQALTDMSKLLWRLASKTPMASAGIEGYLPRGIRKNFFADTNGAERAVRMMLARLRGEPFQTEYEMPVFKHIPPARPVKDLASATIALVSSGGIVPRGNPDALRVSSAETFHAYDISRLDALSADSFESVHGGYDRQWANENPNVVLPVDGMRELEKQGIFGRMHPLVYTTTGTGTSVQFAESFGQAIGEELRKAGVSAAILTST